MNILCGKTDFADVIKAQDLDTGSVLDYPGGLNLIKRVLTMWLNEEVTMKERLKRCNIAGFKDAGRAS